MIILIFVLVKTFRGKLECKEFDNKSLLRMKDVLNHSHNIVIVCHLSPDGDALGSSLGLQRFLSNCNPSSRVKVITPDEPTRSLSFLWGYNEIIAFSSRPEMCSRLIDEAETIVCLDFNNLSRIDLLAPAIKNANATKILIDHHIDPENFADLTFSFPEYSSTCLLLFSLLENAGMEIFIDPVVANSFLTGILTDTGNLSYNVNNALIFESVAQLIQMGADKAKLTKLLFQTSTESCLRIQGFALAERMEIFENMHAALIVLEREDLNRFGYRKGDTEGLVNKPLEIPGIIYSCFLREETDYIKVSMRSQGNFPVNELCRQYFEGGGHLNAAGGEFHGSMEQCITTFKNTLELNRKKYIDNEI